MVGCPSDGVRGSEFRTLIKNEPQVVGQSPDSKVFICPAPVDVFIPPPCVAKTDGKFTISCHVREPDCSVLDPFCSDSEGLVGSRVQIQPSSCSITFPGGFLCNEMHKGRAYVTQAGGVC